MNGHLVGDESFSLRVRPDVWGQDEAVNWAAQEDGTPVKVVFEGEKRSGELRQFRGDGLLEIRIEGDNEKQYRVCKPADVTLDDDQAVLV